MPLSASILGRIRKVGEAVDAASPDLATDQITLSGQIETLIAQAAAPYSEVVRPGRSFSVHTTAAVAAVVAVPTTAVMLGLYNNEPDGGRSYVLDYIGALNVVSTAVAASANLLLLIGQQRDTAPTTAGLTITKNNGLGAGADTKALTILNATALSAGTGVAANWLVASTAFAKAGAVATPGYGHFQPLDGRFIVAPGRFAAVHVMANVVGETFLAYIGWHEKSLALG